jgi:6-phosphogluconolactonase
MQKLQFNANAAAEVIAFEDFSSLALATLPFITKGNIALSGGSTYTTLFPFWAALKPDCARASFFPVDERIVAFDDPQSNWGSAYKNFLLPLKKGADKGNFPQSAQHYESILKSKFNSFFPVFDLVFLGVGDDGHTASLFPGEPYLSDVSSIVLETTSPKPPFKRITLGIAPLVAANKMIVIIAGKEKGSIYNRIVEKDLDLPIVNVLSKRADSLVFVEQGLV